MNSMKAELNWQDGMVVRKIPKETVSRWSYREGDEDFGCNRLDGFEHDFASVARRRDVVHHQLVEPVLVVFSGAPEDLPDFLGVHEFHTLDQLAITDVEA